MSVVNKSHNSGFSMIELIAVVVLLGILSIVALGRFTDPDEFAARGFFDDTVAAVGFAQKLAISSGCDVRVSLAVASFQLLQSSTCTADDFANPVANPANRSNVYQNSNIPAGFSLTAGTVTFNARGAREEATSVFSLTDGSTTYSFRVHVTTGLVEVL